MPDSGKRYPYGLLGQSYARTGEKQFRSRKETARKLKRSGKEWNECRISSLSKAKHLLSEFENSLGLSACQEPVLTDAMFSPFPSLLTWFE